MLQNLQINSSFIAYPLLELFVYSVWTDRGSIRLGAKYIPISHKFLPPLFNSFMDVGETGASAIRKVLGAARPTAGLFQASSQFGLWYGTSYESPCLPGSQKTLFPSKEGP